MPNPRTVDMSAEAITRRLEVVRSLYRLMQSLRTVRILGPVEALNGAAAREPEPR